MTMGGVGRLTGGKRQTERRPLEKKGMEESYECQPSISLSPSLPHRTPANDAST